MENDRLIADELKEIMEMVRDRRAAAPFDPDAALRKLRRQIVYVNTQVVDAEENEGEESGRAEAWRGYCHGLRWVEAMIFGAGPAVFSPQADPPPTSDPD